MTDAELRQLAEIERRLIAESPELRRLFDDAVAGRQSRRRLWWAAAAVTLLISAGLLAAGLAMGLPGLAVAAVCPPAALGIVLLGSLLLARGVFGDRRGRGR